VDDLAQGIDRRTSCSANKDLYGSKQSSMAFRATSKGVRIRTELEKFKKKSTDWARQLRPHRWTGAADIVTFDLDSQFRSPMRPGPQLQRAVHSTAEGTR